MIKRYFREQLKYMLWMAAVCAIFIVLWLLCGANAVAGTYCIFLIAFVSAAFFVLNYYREKRRHNAMLEVFEAIAGFEGEFPEVSGVLDNDYRELAQAQREIIKKSIDDGKRAQNEAVEYFTMWVHQAKTPVSALHLLFSERSPDIMRCEQELFKIERYVDMALKYVKTEDIALDMVFAPCDADKIIRESVKKYAVLFIGKKLNVTVEKTGIRFITDEKWFAFILEQLISNAVKYTKTGGVRIYGGDRVICVEDTGSGIMASDLPRVFDKGFTGYNGRIDKRASGIGLYMTKRVAKALGVTVTLDSAPGVGTKATLILPKTVGHRFE